MGVIMMGKELTLFEEAKKSRVLLNGVLSTIIMLVFTFVGQLIGGILLGVIGIVCFIFWVLFYYFPFFYYTKSCTITTLV